MGHNITILHVPVFVDQNLKSLIKPPTLEYQALQDIEPTRHFAVNTCIHINVNNRRGCTVTNFIDFKLTLNDTQDIFYISYIYVFFQT